MSHKTISLDDIKMLINNFEKLNPISLNIPKEEAAIQIFLELSGKKDINESLKLIIDMILLKEFEFPIDEINRITYETKYFNLHDYVSWM